MKTAHVLECALFFLMIAASSFAQENNSFSAANKAFSQGRYEEAQHQYEARLHDEGWSADVLYNLGNTCFELKRTGCAVLNYRRSLYLNPRQPDARANLARVLSDAGIFTDEPSKLKGLFLTLSLNEWSWLFCASLVFLSAAAVFTAVQSLRRLRRGEQTPAAHPGSLKRITFAAPLVLLVASALGVLFQFSQLRESVVISSDARLLVSPFDGAANVATLKEGQTVSGLREYEGFFEVQDANGQSGWVNRAAVERVVE